jgi:hypothetical protein
MLVSSVFEVSFGLHLGHNVTDLLREFIGSTSINTAITQQRKAVFSPCQTKLCWAVPRLPTPCLAMLVAMQHMTSTTVQNALFFSVLHPGFIGDTEVSSWKVLSEFSAEDSRGRFVLEEDLNV